MMRRYPWVVLAVLLFIHVIAHVDRNLLLAFSPQITGELALSNTQFGFLAGAVWVLSFGFMALFLGSLADRFSRPRIIAAGILVWSACTAASGIAQDFGQLVAARFFVASGEAALVPAATALLTDIFDSRHRGTATGVFFIGIPLGMGVAFVLAGTIGAGLGWRGTFVVLGVIGVLIAVPLALVREDRSAGTHERGEPFLAQMKSVALALRENRRVALTIAGFVLVHVVFAGFSFVQLWLVRERGLDPAGIAQKIGLLQIAFGTLGALIGGALGDRVAGRFRGGHATFLALLVAICGPLMLTYRFVDPGSPLFYVGMAASIFLPLSAYGSALAIVQGELPARMRSTAAGATMLCINVFAIAIGNLSAGAVSDRLAQAGFAAPLTAVLVGLDVIAMSSILLFMAAARFPAASAATQNPGQTSPKPSATGRAQ
jgi:predicted MFS family arabinose efflux permease